MSRKAKWPPPIHRHPSGRARVRIKGQDYWLGKHGSPEAASAYARLIAELATGAGPPSRGKPKQGLLVAEVVALWWAHAETTISDRGKEKPNFCLSLKPLLRLYGPTPATEFGANQLEAVQQATASGAWMNEAEQERARKRGDKIGCSRKVTNRRIVRIRTVWRWAERKGHVPPGAWAGLLALPGIPPGSPLARPSEDVRPATVGELCRVMRCAHRTIRDALRLGFYAGLRPAEICLMRECEIDRSGEVWVYRPVKHKNDWRGHLRIVPLGPKARNIVRRRLPLAGPEGHLFSPALAKRSRTKRLHYDAETYSRAVARAAERAGLKGLHAYQTRHAAKERITRALGLDSARSVLGQKSIGQTNDYSAGVDFTLAAAAAKRLG